jgi:cytochrome P450
MEALTEDMLQSWSPGQRVNVEFEFGALTSRIALKALFDIDNAGDRQRFADKLHLVFDIMTARLRSVFKAPLWLPTPETVRLKRGIRELDEVVNGFIESGRKRDSGSGDLLSRLVHLEPEDGVRMTDKQLRDELMTLYLASHETTALTLAWTWYLLSQNPDAEERVVDEWRCVLGGRIPSVEDVANLPDTAKVILESLRLCPAVYVIGREATKDLELGGYRVKRGNTVFMSQWVSHRDPKYFPDPESFKPQRWDNGLQRKLPKFVYYPFGGGQRVCVGNTFALLEAAIILAGVGQRYRFTLAPDADIAFKPQITLLPANKIPAILERR